MFVSQVHKIWEMVEKVKKDLDRLLLVSKLKKSSVSVKYTVHFFWIDKTKSKIIISTISQIFKRKFYVF